MGPRGPPGPPGKPGDDVSTPESIKWLPHLKGPGERGCWAVMGGCTLGWAQGRGSSGRDSDTALSTFPLAT